MLTFISKLVNIIGIIATVALIILIIIGIFSWLRKDRVPRKTVLELNLGKGIVEHIPDVPLAKAMMGKPLELKNVVGALEKASTDDRVLGLLVRTGKSSLGWAQIQEIRNAISAFREHDKPALAFAESFGELSAGNKTYYLATSCDEIYMQPSGDLGITGLISETPFLGGTMNKLDMKPRLDSRKEYKTAKNILTETDYTESHREANKKIVESIFEQTVEAISRTRGLPGEEVETLFDDGPLLGKEALDAKLVDGLLYRSEIYDILREKFGRGSKALSLKEYLKRAGAPYRKGETVALIYGTGQVARGSNKYNPVSGAMIMGSDDITSAFRTAIKDKHVKAIIFRVNSPGGSYVASDAIWKATLRAREAGKPVIVTMGDVAGSGGYFVSMAANKIIAQPGAITGSIGVVGGKIITRDFWNKLGISFDDVQTSEHASMWSMQHDYSPEEWARLQDWLDRIYKDFTEKVASGRGLSMERVQEIAKGRIWTGQDARDLGLVDELGGFKSAIKFAKKEAQIPEDKSVKLKVFPRKRSYWEMLLGRDDHKKEKELPLAVMKQTFEMIQPVAGYARQLGLTKHPGALYMSYYPMDF